MTKLISGKDLSKSITSDDLLGKDVIDIEGRLIGVVEKILIDPESLELIGIGIDKGFLKKGLEIGKEYLDRVTPYALFLSISVLLEIKGMKVFDIGGFLLGTVSKIELENDKNIIKNINIKPTSGIFRKTIEINANNIASIRYGIFLNVPKESLISVDKMKNEK